MRRPILNNSSPGQAVYEPFMGSGTTLIAAETTGRVCLGIELNPAYVDVAVERWQRFTGKAAVLDGNGGSFDKLRDERVQLPCRRPSRRQIGKKKGTVPKHGPSLGRKRP